MKYTVTINEKSKSITVDLDGYKGTAKCCPTDSFNITTGIELALERAKVAKANAEKPTAKPMSVTELVKALEKALPKGQMVIVGNGEGLSKAQKNWLHSLTDCKGGGYTKDDLDKAYQEGYEDGKDECDCCDCDDCDYCFTQEEYDEAVDDAYDEGYADGHSDGYDEGVEEGIDEDEVIEAVRNALRQ